MPVILTTENIQSFYKEIPGLPASFRDAIKIVKRLGVRYLWIDSLCIIQRGSRHVPDWQRHIAEMAEVYANCFLNIAASHSPNSHGGCFSTRPLALIGACGIQADYRRPEDDKNSPPLIAIVPHAYGMIQKSKLNTRAWVFQERLLSPRVVHFEQTDVFSECRELCASASFPRGLDNFMTGLGDLHTFRKNGTGFKRYFDIEGLHMDRAFEASHWEAHPSFFNRTSKANRAHWQDLHVSYTHLALTSEEDRLPGIAALAHRLNQSFFHGRYFARFF